MQATENRVQTRGFGVFEVDERAAELRKRGIRIKLQEQPFQILCLLLDHSGEVVTREELRHKLWPAHTFVDGAFLDPKARVRPQLQIHRIVETGDFVGPISEGNLDNMQHNVRTSLHVEPKIMESFSSPLPAVRV